MEILDFLKNYWTQIIFFISLLGGFYSYSRAMIRATKCSLRNDILSIYDRAIKRGQITKFELSAINLSYEQYKKLKGNSFVDDLVKKVKNLEIID